MYIRRVEFTLRDDVPQTPDDPSDSIPPQPRSNGGNGLLNFSIALGGILLVTIITGIIAYLYRKKLNFRQKESSQNDSSESVGGISTIMDYYSNDYVTNSNNSYMNNDNDGFSDDKKEALDSNIIITDKKERNTNMTKGFKINVSTIYTRTSNPILSNTDTTKAKRIKSDMINIKSKNTKSIEKPVTYTSEKSKSLVEYTVPKISAPISMPSASIYDIERVSSLANNISRSNAFVRVPSPPPPPLPVHPSTNNKQSKDIERHESVSKFNSFYHLIPIIYADSSDNSSITEIVSNVNNGLKSPTIPPSTTTTSSNLAGVIPDWSKAPWHDRLNKNDNGDNIHNDDNVYNNDNIHNNNNIYNHNNIYNNNISSSSSNYSNYNNNYNYNYNSNNYDNYNNSEDLIRFSNNSKVYRNSSKNNPRNHINHQDNLLKSNSVKIRGIPEISEPESQVVNKRGKDFIKELKKNIEKDPEKYEFLKNPAENSHNWKRNGNFFDYKLQRSKSVI